jgi:capsid portal protein
MTKLDIVGQIADMKEIDYKNTLAIASIIELLIDKGVINRNDIALKAHKLENITLDEIRENRLASIGRK